MGSSALHFTRFPAVVSPVYLALTGVLIEQIGVVRTILLWGIGLLILALAMTLNPHIRKMRWPVGG